MLLQFLGRDKDDGVRRSAVSGKKVKAVGPLQFSLLAMFSCLLDAFIYFLNRFLLCRFF